MIFIDNGPDEAIVGRLDIFYPGFEAVLLTLIWGGNEVFLFAIEGVHDRLHSFRWRSDTIKDEA